MRILYILPSLSKCSGVTTFAMNYFEKFSVNTKIDFLIINNKVDEYYRKIIEERKSKIYVLEKPKITNVISGVNKIWIVVLLEIGWRLIIIPYSFYV